MPNYEHQYDELTEVEQDPRYLRLCTMQTKEASALSSKHAQQRLSLALTIRKEAKPVITHSRFATVLVPETWDDDCFYPDSPWRQ